MTPKIVRSDYSGFCKAHGGVTCVCLYIISCVWEYQDHMSSYCDNKSDQSIIVITKC